MEKTVAIGGLRDCTAVAVYLPRPAYEVRFSMKDILVDLRAERVWRAGRELDMTAQEFALLAALIAHHDHVLSREQLFSMAWGCEYIGVSRTVDVHINHLRRKLGLKNEIQTVFKVGYRLNTRGAA